MKSTSTHDLINDGHWAILSLRVAGFVTALSVIIALAWTADKRGDARADVNLGGAFDYMVLGTSVCTFLYSLGAFITRLHIRRPIHPGIYIGPDLVAFVVFFIMTAMFWTFVQPFDKSSSHSGTVAGVELFAGIMALINCAIHLTSFVWGCWAVYHYRKWSRKAVSVTQSSA